MTLDGAPPRRRLIEWTSTISGRTYTTYPRGTTGAWRGTTTGTTGRP